MTAVADEIQQHLILGHFIGIKHKVGSYFGGRAWPQQPILAAGHGFDFGTEQIGNLSA
jgi:hypothetical protein